MVKNVHLSSSLAITQLVNHQKMLRHDGMKFTKQIIMNIYFDKDIFLCKREIARVTIKDETMYTDIMNHQVLFYAESYQNALKDTENDS